MRISANIARYKAVCMCAGSKAEKIERRTTEALGGSFPAAVRYMHGEAEKVG